MRGQGESDSNAGHQPATENRHILTDVAGNNSVKKVK